MSKKSTKGTATRLPRGRRSMKVATSSTTTQASTETASILTGGEEMLIKIVAKAIGVRPSTAYDYVRAGLIASIKLHDGPRAPIRVRRADLDRYLADRVRGGTATNLDRRAAR